MSGLRRIARIGRWRLLVVLVATLAISGVAYAGTVYQYSSGVYGAGTAAWTSGYDPRDFNRVYHQAGNTWQVWYNLNGGSAYWGFTTSNVNPTQMGSSVPSGHYAQAVCANVNDNSGVIWTCQTTRP
jgi:hypothetical protein